MLVKVWLLPPVSDDRLEKLLEAIVDTIVATPEIGDPYGVTVLFPSDLVESDLGEELIVEITKVFDKSKGSDGVLAVLAERVGTLVAKYALGNLPDCEFVEVFLETFHHQRAVALRLDLQHNTNSSSVTVMS